MGSLGIKQARLKQWLIKVQDKIPKWQQREARYIIKMYHDIMMEINAFLSVKG